MNNDEVNQVVDVLKKLGRPASSPEVMKALKEQTGENLSPAQVYRRLLTASGTGRVSQDERRRWTYDGDGTAVAREERTHVASAVVHCENASLAADLYEAVVKVLRESPPDIVRARKLRRSADLLLEG